MFKKVIYYSRKVVKSLRGAHKKFVHTNTHTLFLLKNEIKCLRANENKRLLPMDLMRGHCYKHLYCCNLPITLAMIG